MFLICSQVDALCLMHLGEGLAVTGAQVYHKHYLQKKRERERHTHGVHRYTKNTTYKRNYLYYDSRLWLFDRSSSSAGACLSRCALSFVTLHMPHVQSAPLCAQGKEDLNSKLKRWSGLMDWKSSFLRSILFFFRIFLGFFCKKKGPHGPRFFLEKIHKKIFPKKFS